MGINSPHNDIQHITFHGRNLTYTDSGFNRTTLKKWYLTNSLTFVVFCKIFFVENFFSGYTEREKHSMTRFHISRFQLRGLIINEVRVSTRTIGSRNKHTSQILVITAKSLSGKGLFDRKAFIVLPSMRFSYSRVIFRASLFVPYASYLNSFQEFIEHIYVRSRISNVLYEKHEYSKSFAFYCSIVFPLILNDGCRIFVYSFLKITIFTC